MYGISVFLNQQTEQEQADYLRSMKQAGFQSVFTSLHIPEDNPALYIDAVKILGAEAKKLEMDLIADVSPASLQHLNTDLDHLQDLKSLGLTGLRVDYGFSPAEAAAVSRQMTLAVNASTVTRELLSDLFDAGLAAENTEVWHNYYPRPETGLDKQEFTEKNRWLKSIGLMTAAFVPGNQRLRGPLKAGLPTLEKHRNTAPFTAAKELTSDCSVDRVIIGDPSVSEETRHIFSKASSEVVIPLRAKLEDLSPNEKEIVALVHNQRLDPARDVIRSETSRPYARKGSVVIEPALQKERLRGSITIDNAAYGRYQGELQITKTDLPEDARVNTAGFLIEEDLPLIDVIQPGDKFIILPR
ncbi:MupG family TIM beta-alpha barrel fold protein [Salipaludibacillus sp. CUR1]|uniref:DUF871 domain-containing protein n=1 Tax=Salipaludibacillus sp. CUR1 TaxID=2820003 RepID=UPI001E44BB91|nr:MupG family TIM beta-alpha barrel fold protein [Salipaludibacillus sp. CUR1]MCE7791690.1 MupG family TIM beta-alpha barrel fold protein [Salipaludibacillus sp. CUR1]